MKYKKVSIFNYIDRAMLLSTLDEIAKASKFATFLIEPGMEMPIFSHYSAFPSLCRLVKTKTRHQCKGCFAFIRKMVHNAVIDQMIHTCPMGMKFTASPIAVGRGVARAVIVCGFARFEPFSEIEYENIMKLLPVGDICEERIRDAINQVPIIPEHKLISVGDYVQHSCITVMKNYMVSNNRSSGSVEHEMAMLKNQILAMQNDNGKTTSLVTMNDEKKLIEAIIARNRQLSNKRAQKLLEKLFQEQWDPRLIKFWVMELGVIICNAPLFSLNSSDLDRLQLNHLVDIPSTADLSLTQVQLWFNKLIEKVMDHMDVTKDSNLNSSEFRVKLAIEYINSQPKSKLTVGHIAKYVSLSQQHLNRLFQKEVGMSLVKYIMNAKLEEGKQLLINSDLIVAEIAEQLEFYDVAHFSRNFKKSFFLTPAKYRSEYKNRSNLNERAQKKDGNC